MTHANAMQKLASHLRNACHFDISVHANGAAIRIFLTKMSGDEISTTRYGLSKFPSEIQVFSRAHQVTFKLLVTNCEAVIVDVSEDVDDACCLLRHVQAIYAHWLWSMHRGHYWRRGRTSSLCGRKRRRSDVVFRCCACEKTVAVAMTDLQASLYAKFSNWTCAMLPTTDRKCNER